MSNACAPSPYFRTSRPPIRQESSNCWANPWQMWIDFIYFQNESWCIEQDNNTIMLSQYKGYPCSLSTPLGPWLKKRKKENAYLRSYLEKFLKTFPNSSFLASLPSNLQNWLNLSDMSLACLYSYVPEEPEISPITVNQATASSHSLPICTFRHLVVPSQTTEAKLH